MDSRRQYRRRGQRSVAFDVRLGSVIVLGDEYAEIPHMLLMVSVRKNRATDAKVSDIIQRDIDPT